MLQSSDDKNIFTYLALLQTAMLNSREKPNLFDVGQNTSNLIPGGFYHSEPFILEINQSMRNKFVFQ